MDRVDLERSAGRPGQETPAPPGPPADPDQAAWRALAEAGTPDAFHRAWLALQCRQIPGAVAGVVVLETAGGRYAPIASWPEGRRGVRHLGEVAERALKERRGLVVPRTVRRPDETVGRTRYHVAFPIERQGKVQGVVALEVAPRHERDVTGILRHIQWGVSWLDAYFLRDEVARLAATRDRVQAALELAASAFAHPGGFSHTATGFVTAVATRLGCDRVSLGFLRHGRARVRAISHTAQFRKETNLSRAIANAMDEAIDQAAAVVYPAPPDAPPRVSRMHAELSRQHGAPSTCSVPLVEGVDVVGALTLERPEPFDAETLALVEALASLAGPILELARRDDRWLLAKAADSAGRAVGAVIGPRHVALKLGLAAAVAVAAFLATAVGPFRVAGTTTLEPRVRRAVVAPFSGYVAEAPARAGDVVAQGQLLARLDDRELRLERLKLASQLDQLTRQYDQARALRNPAQVVILSAQLDQIRPQLALLDDQLRRTRLEAPFAGLVVAGDLSQSQAAPVERGQVLYEVSPLDGFRVAVQVDERDIASVAVGQRGTLVLTGKPAMPLEFAVEKLTPVSTVNEARNYFRVEGTLAADPGGLRPGMEGVAKIEVGRRRLVFIWTREIVDWARLQLWRWLP